ncbi:efflux RND transporter periplasmic adaptor subunit [Paenibacillus turpanensis]|uniref:efflux RND transporter periplasmic adaptor subunit n=1 Tax=Paenibacillus turpanensis TaxID=2689078 RepID=UPI00140A7368|nr:efflux RND transporter periplasmic adaptor subunit [Paenibacillus turpanensis]
MKIWKQPNHVLQRSALTVGTVVLGAALIVGCSAQPPAGEGTQAAQESQIKTVKTEKVQKQKIGDPLEQVADVTASVQIDVSAKVGAEVQEILKKRGDYVTAGETIVRLKQDDAALSLQSAELALRSAQRSYSTSGQEIANQKKEMANNVASMEQNYKTKLENLNKQRNDFDLGLIEERELQQAETEVALLADQLDLLKKKQATLNATLSQETYEIQLKQAQIQYEQAQKSMEHYNIEAPISGLLTDLPLEVAMTTQPGSKALTVLQMDPVKIKADLTESSAKLIQGKSELKFYVPGTTEVMTGKISYLSQVMNPSTKSYALELEVSNADGKLIPGNKVQILLTEEQDQMVVAIPTSSVVREGSENFVFVLKGDTVERRKVELGRLKDTIQEVLSGVSEGEDLVISGQHQLVDKEKVTVKN